MLDDLRGRIRGLPAGDYMTARRFLESLVNEARMPSRFETAMDMTAMRSR